MNNFGVIQKECIGTYDPSSENYMIKYKDYIIQDKRQQLLAFVEQRYKNIFGNKYRNLKRN